MLRMRRIITALLLVSVLIGVQGCGGLTLPSPSPLGENLPAQPASTGDLAKDRDALLKQTRELQGRLASNKAEISQLDADIETEQRQALKTKLLILSGLLVVAAIVCIGLIVAFPNPALSKLEWFGAVLFGALSVGCWFFTFVLAYWHWIILGTALLVVGLLLWWVLVGRRGIVSTQLASGYADALEQAALAFTPEEHRESLASSIKALKDTARSKQQSAGVWKFIDRSRSTVKNLKAA